MTRLLHAMHTDVLLQSRNRLYAISVGVAALFGAALAPLASPSNLALSIPTALLLFVGGSTLMYVVAMIILEKADGVLAALTVSPLRPREYLASKVLTLTGIATLEALFIVVAATVAADVPAPDLRGQLLLLSGVIGLGVLHVLAGIVLVARHDRLTDALVPVSALAILFQLPAFHFAGAADFAPLLAIPSAAPTLLLRAAYAPLSPLEWTYALGGTATSLVALAFWASRAFEKHVVRGGA